MKIAASQKTAIVYGATGLIGSHCVELLLAHDAYTKVKVFVRKPINLKHEKLEVHIINFDNMIEDAYDHMTGHDLFICLGTTMKQAGSKAAFYKVDYKYVVLAAAMGVKQGVSQLLLVSAVGADKDAAIFYNQVKGEVEEAVKTMDYWAIYIVQPSLLIGSRKQIRPSEEVGQWIGRLINTVTDTGLGKYQPVYANDVAMAMISMAQQLEKGLHVIPSHQIVKHLHHE